MYNKIILVGNLTRDIETRFSQGGMAVAKTAIATSRKFKSNTGEQKEEVCFVDITFFGRSAEIANQYLRKGSKVLIEGRLMFDQWVDQNGQKRSKHSVNVDMMQMLDTKGSDNNSMDYNDADSNRGTNKNPTYNENHQTQTPPTYVPKQRPEQVPEIDIDEDEIPF